MVRRMAVVGRKARKNQVSLKAEEVGLMTTRPMARKMMVHQRDSRREGATKLWLNWARPSSP